MNSKEKEPNVFNRSARGRRKTRREYLQEQSELHRKLLEIFRYIGGLPYEEIVRVGHVLNKWEWPDVLPGKPENWDEMQYDEKCRWVSPIRRYIKASVGEKALLRYHHKSEFGSSDQAFDDWWDSFYRECSEECCNKTDCGCRQTEDRNNGAYYFYRIIEIALLSVGSFLLGAFVSGLVF